MPKNKGPIPQEIIERRIYVIRDHKVMLDFDLAELYGVEVKALNQAVTRNTDRFPDDFMFPLSAEEWDDLRSQIVTAKVNSHQEMRRNTPRAFTQEGVAMLSSVLRSPRAVQVNVAIMRVFVQIREAMISHKDLARKIEAMERNYDHNFQIVFDALRKLMEPSPVKKGQIGYIHHDDGKGPSGRRR